MGILTTKSDEPWVGRERASFATNPLLHAPPLGAPRKTTFNSPPSDQVFGAKAKGDAEGAKEVISSWAEHTPSPAAPKSTRPTKSNTHASRSQSAAAAASPNQASAATATAAAAATYGRPPGYHSAEERRAFGPTEPRIRDLLRGAFAREWVDANANAARAAQLAPNAGAIPPRTTRAAEGHRSCALARLAAPLSGSAGASGGSGGWKMPRFLRTAPRVTAYMGGAGHGIAATIGGGGGGGSGGGPIGAEEDGTALYEDGSV